MALPGQTFTTNGVSNLLFGSNILNGNESDFINNQVSGASSAGITVIRYSLSPNSGTRTDSQILAINNAILSAGAVPLAILGYHIGYTYNAHCVALLGSNCLLYEFGNEPDLGGISTAQYSGQWNTQIPQLRKINSSAAFLGPVIGVSPDHFDSYLVPFLQNCKASGVIPDGVSYHIYPCTGNGIDQSTCSAKAPSIGNVGATCRQKVVGVLGYNLPVCCTEWNVDANYAQSYLSNGTFQSAFVISALDSLVNNNIDMACQFAVERAGGNLLTATGGHDLQYTPFSSEVTHYLTGGGGSPAPNVSVSPSSLSASIVVSGSAVTQSVTVSNTGSASGSVVVTTTYGQTPTNWASVSMSSTTISASSSATANITMQPLASQVAGTYTATVIFQMGNTTAQVQLTMTVTAATVNNTSHIFVPAYSYPTDPSGTGTTWAQYENGSPAVSFIIANVSNGPGASANSDYTTGIANMHANSVNVLGYVTTSSGGHLIAESTVKAQIDSWYSFYTIDGIFLDTALATTQNITYYTDLYNYIRGKDAIRNYVMINPASIPPETYMPILDTVCVFEDVLGNIGNFNAQSYMANYPATKFAAVVQGVSNAASVDSTMSALQSANVGLVYITDQTSTTVYTTPPSTTIWAETIKDCNVGTGSGGTGGGITGAGNPYGVTVGITSGTATLNPQLIVDMKNLNMTWLRLQVPWSAIDSTGTTNQTASTYHWGTWDDAVNKCNSAGINILLTIFKADTQFQNSGSNQPDVPSYTATFAGQIAARYNGGSHGLIAGIEVGNEDYDNAAGTSATPLVATLKAVYPAVKAVNPNMVVGAAALLQRNESHYTSFMETLLNPSTGAYISSVFQADYLNFHFYTGIPQTSTGGPPVHLDPTIEDSTYNGGAGIPSIDKAWQLIQAKTQQYSLNIACWCTETGWTINTNPGRLSSFVVSQAQQWQYLQDVLESCRKSNFVGKVFIFTLAYYDGYGAPNYRDGMSLVQGPYSNPTYTTAYNGLKTYISQYAQWSTLGGGGGGTGTVTPLSVYLASTAASTIGTANLLYITANSGTPGNTWKYSRVGTAKGYGELTSQGTTSAWAAATSLPNPTGKGFLLDNTSLEGQTIQAGNWAGVVRMHCAQNGDTNPNAGSLTADIIARAFKYNGGTYTPITTITLGAQHLSSTATSFTLPNTNTSAVSFGTGDKLYIDYWLNVTANTNGSSVQDVRLNRESTDTSGHTGDANATIGTPGYNTTSTSGSSGNLVVSPSSLAFNASQGTGQSATQNVTIENTGGSSAAWQAQITYQSGYGWLQLSTSSGTLVPATPQSIAVNATPAGLSSGTYIANLTFSMGTASYSVYVTFVVSGSGTGGSGGGPLSTNLTNAGVNLMRDSMAGKDSDQVKFIALGTGGTSPTAGDTQLANEVFRKAITSFANGPNPGELIISCYLAPNDAVGFSIAEVGVFGGNSCTSQANTGVLIARVLYTLANKTQLEGVQLVLDLTI